MKRDEAVSIGATIGRELAQRASEDKLRNQPDELMARAEVSAEMARLHAGRGEAMFEAALRAYRGALVNRHNELPDVKAKRTFDAFKRKLEQMIDGAKTTLATFRQRVDTDPVYAFEWSDAAFQSAAQIHVGTYLLMVLCGPPEGMENKPGAYGVEAMLNEARKEALRGARHPEHSTSIPSNLVKTYITSVYAEVVDWGGWI